VGWVEFDFGCEEKILDPPEKKYLKVEIYLSQEPEIGRWLWALQDTRRRTIRELKGASPAAIDWLPSGTGSSIGAVLYHIAGIEADWLYAEVLEQPVPIEVAALFPHDIRDGQGYLSQVQGISLEQHIRRLEVVRGLLLDVYQQMDLSEFRRVRSLTQNDVTPEWILHHLMQHEAEHRSQIGALRNRAENKLGLK
jgi:uncharacterized damage-inducible protein DinB